MNNGGITWFGKNRRFIFGFAVVILVLNLVILVLMPQQTAVRYTGTETAYDPQDESFAEEHTVTIDGTLTKSIFGKPQFLGTFYIDGVERLTEELMLELTREDGRWNGSFRDAAGQAMTVGIADIEADKNFGDIIVIFWDRFEESGDRVMASADPENARFLCVGAKSRYQAVYRQQEYCKNR